jgi:TPR repeat protein
MWLVVRAEGDRTVPLPLSIKIDLGVGLCYAVLVGSAVAALAYPLLFLVSLPSKNSRFSTSYFFFTEGVNYLWMLGIIVTVLLVPVLGCIWLEVGREPPPIVDPPFSPLAHQEHVVWSHLIADQQLAPAFEAFKRGGSKKAFEVFKRFADQGNAAAQNNVGVMCESGFGVEMSDAHAEEYYRRAAEQGVRTAQFNLAALLVGDTLRSGTSEHGSATDGRLVEGL